MADLANLTDKMSPAQREGVQHMNSTISGLRKKLQAVKHHAEKGSVVAVGALTAAGTGALVRTIEEAFGADMGQVKTAEGLAAIGYGLSFVVDGDMAHDALRRMADVSLGIATHERFGPTAQQIVKSLKLTPKAKAPAPGAPGAPPATGTATK